MADYDRLVRYEPMRHEPSRSRHRRHVMPRTSELHRFIAMGVAASSGLLQPSIAEVLDAEFSRQRAYAQQALLSSDPLNLGPRSYRSDPPEHRSNRANASPHRDPSTPIDTPTSSSSRRTNARQINRRTQESSSSSSTRLPATPQDRNSVIILNSDSEEEVNRESQTCKTNSDRMSVTEKENECERQNRSESDDDGSIEVVAHRYSTRPVFDLTQVADEDDEEQGHDKATSSNPISHEPARTQTPDLQSNPLHHQVDGDSQRLTDGSDRRPRAKRDRDDEDEESIQHRLNRNRQRLEKIRRELSNMYMH
eukprot:TRINITY_DN6707_c0_g1_i2.p1 TRINITY_DN6707_c0_g1~~TRINITY_DN6707_c0_g1_i2.p1  ORF type:complete len:309 (+),score=59.36 TRINITY_DN6707_c0_g1_i2:252-1178(+)